MLLGKRENERLNISDNFIASLIDAGQYKEAYLILREADRERLCVTFNISLCLIYAEEYAKALVYLEKLQSLLSTHIQLSDYPKDETAKSIDKQQNKSESYKKPVTEEYIRLFPEIFKESVLRLVLDCYAALKEWSMVKRIMSLLQNKQYGNVKLIIEKMTLDNV